MLRIIRLFYICEIYDKRLSISPSKHQFTLSTIENNKNLQVPSSEVNKIHYNYQLPDSREAILT